MHRSGTSAFTRVLNLLGAHLARHLLPPAPDNMRGFWESSEVVSLHEEVLASGDTTWDDWSRFDPAWYESPLAEVYKARLLTYLAADFGTSSLFVVKDPRMCRLLRLWRDSLRTVGVEPRVIIPLRHPWEVAQSLKSRDGFSHVKSYLLWLRHLVDALRDSDGVPRCVVSYDGLLKDWRSTTLTIARQLNVRWPRQSRPAEAEIDEFLCERERHHVFDDAAWRGLPDTVEWVARAYRLVLSMASAAPGDPVPDELLSLASQFDTASGVFGPLLQEQREAAMAERNAAREMHAKLVAAEARLGDNERVIEQLQARLGEREQIIERLQGELGQDERLIESLQAQLGQGERGIEMLRARLGREERGAAQLESELQEARGRLERVFASRSWRFTAPLRETARTWSRLREVWFPRIAPSPAASPSERLCDVVVLAFALWTVASHAVVAAGGSLVALLLVYAGLLIPAFWLRRRLDMGAPAPDPLEGTEPPDWPDRARWILRGAVLVAAAVTALSFAARPVVLELWWFGVTLLGLAAVAVYLREQPLMVAAEDGHSSEVLLWLLSAGAVVLTLISNRSDADDAFYVNVAAAAADVPWRALFSGDTMHGISGFPLHLPAYRVHSYELLNGALAYLTAIPAIYVFHWLSASFAALLVPLAHARLFRILTPRRWLAAVATLMFVLVAAGETHRWYGNFSFVRMWQGKAIFLFVFMPLVYAYALRFAARPNLRDWTLLTGAQIAAVGCSSSALWVAPAGAAVALASSARPTLQTLKTVALGALSSLYVLALAWHTKSTLVGPFFMGGSVAADGDPGPLLLGALVAVLGDARLLVFGLVALLVGWVFAPPGLARRFAVLAPLVLLLGLLNPYLATWVPANITGPSYWRSMWTVPLPILIVLILMSPLLRQGGGSWSRRAAWLFLLAGFAILVPRYSGVSAQNGVQLGWPTLKVPEPAYEWAATINHSVAPGSHVAVPSPIDAWIPTFQHPVYPLAVRYYLFPWENLLSQDDMQARMAMQRSLGAPELVETTQQQFRDGLDRFAVQAVCLVNSPRAAAARAILQQAGFQQTRRGDDYELWVRPQARLTLNGKPR